jgi:hypothetical protein
VDRIIIPPDVPADQVMEWLLADSVKNYAGRCERAKREMGDNFTIMVFDVEEVAILRAALIKLAAESQPPSNIVQQLLLMFTEGMDNAAQLAPGGQG